MVSFKDCHTVNTPDHGGPRTLKTIPYWVFQSSVSATVFRTIGLCLMFTKSSDMNCQEGVRKWSISSQMSLFFKRKGNGRNQSNSYHMVAADMEFQG